MNVKFGDCDVIRLRMSLMDLQTILDGHELLAELKLGERIILSVHLLASSTEQICGVKEEQKKIFFTVEREKLQQLYEKRNTRENSFSKIYNEQTDTILSVELDRFKLKDRA